MFVGTYSVQTTESVLTKFIPKIMYFGTISINEEAVYFVLTPNSVNSQKSALDFLMVPTILFWTLGQK